MTGGSDALPAISNVPFSGGAYTIDNTPPSVSNVTVTSSNANPLVAYPGDVITLTYTVSEPVSQNNPQIDLDGPLNPVSTGGNTYTVSHTMAVGDASVGDIPVEIDLVDSAGNSYSYQNTTNIYYSPQVPATITSVTAPGQASPTNTSSINYNPNVLVRSR